MRYIALVLAVLFVAGTAYAEKVEDAITDSNSEEPPMEWLYDKWDKNDDGRLDEEEFYAGYSQSGLFDDWDANDDGFLVEDELGEGLYRYLDADNDGVIEDDEVEEYGFWDW